MTQSNDTTRSCTKCRETKPLACFPPRHDRPSGFDSHCRDCKHAAYRRWLKNTDKGQECHRRTNIAATKRKRDAIRSYVTDYKTRNGCLYCGEREAICLDLHHREPSQKRYTISRIQNELKNIAVLRTELPKCDVICANCHRKLHAGLLPRARMKGSHGDPP